MRSVVLFVIYAILAFAIAGYLALWLFAAGLGLLNLQGEMEGARQDLMSHLWLIGGVGLFFLIPIVFVIPLLRQKL